MKKPTCSLVSFPISHFPSPISHPPSPISHFPMKKTIYILLAFLALASHLQAQSRQTFIAKGDSCVKEYDYHSAILHYQEARKLADNATVRAKLADCHYQRNEYRQCFDLLNGISEDSLNHDMMRKKYYLLGNLKMQVEQIWCGIAIVKRFPKDSRIVADLMRLYISDDFLQPNTAIRYGTQYCAQDSTNNEVNLALAEAYFHNKKYEESVETYKKVFANNDTTYTALYYTGNAYEYLNQPDSAVVYYRKAVERYPQYAVGYYRLGVVEANLGYSEAALAHLQQAVALYEPSKVIMSIIYRSMGDAKYNLKDYEAADAYWEAALSYSPNEELERKREEVRKEARR